MADDPKPNPRPIVPYPKNREVPLIKAVGIYNQWGPNLSDGTIYSDLWSEYDFISWRVTALII
jgi:hypothetical protein